MPSTSDLTSESAVLAFHMTFLQQRRVVSLAGRANAKHLPVELLLMIFKLVYDQNMKTSPYSDYAAWVEKDIMSPSLFPYAIASVCSLWRDVTSLVPEFWTRIVVLIDSPPILPPEVFLWSRALPIDVTVTRKDSGHFVDSPQERTQAVSIMKTLINPHIHRVRKLFFKVKFSSSLPPFPAGFDGDPRILRYLELICEEDDGVSASAWESLTSTEQQYPALEALSMDGRIYYHACKKDLKWSAKCLSVQSLSVSNFKPNTGESFSSFDFILPLTIMPELGEFYMTNLALVPNSSPSRPVGWTPLYTLNHVELRDIDNFEPIAEIIGVLSYGCSFIFFRSAIGNPGRPFGDSGGGSLTLHDIAADQELIPLLRYWQGHELHVTACPSFNDAVLTLMATEAGDGGSFACAPYVTEIEITDCLNFSIVALKSLISHRIGTHSRIEWLSIRGDAPLISAKDRKWLFTHLHFQLG